MYDFKFSQLDAKVLTFDGVSVSLERKVAMWASLAILVGVSSFLIATAIQLELTKAQSTYVLAAVVGVLIHYSVSGRFLLKDLAAWLGENTPVSILYRKDKKILDRSREELLQVAGKADFRRYIHYQKINPAIGSKRHLLVMAHQRKGDLRAWSDKSTNLKSLADLIFQLHLAEQVIDVDARQEPEAA
mgnify:CR=1 FL=1|tara:strand:+ start:4909 stop:5472 length:564 start_codon:yes stop_codon:yes gene_type:complete